MFSTLLWSSTCCLWYQIWHGCSRDTLRMQWVTFFTQIWHVCSRDMVRIQWVAFFNVKWCMVYGMTWTCYPFWITVYHSMLHKIMLYCHFSTAAKSPSHLTVDLLSLKWEINLCAEIREKYLQSTFHHTLDWHEMHHPLPTSYWFLEKYV